MARGAERRQFGRRWSNVHGWVRVEGRPKMPCIVRNFSEGGALLELPWPCELPEFFRLSIDAIDFDIGCERRHAKPNAVGVRFVSEAEAESRLFYRWLEVLTPRASGAEATGQDAHTV
jgi:hypothetical protein